MMRLQGFMGISSLAKQIQSSFNKSKDTLSQGVRAHANPQSTSIPLKHAVVLLFPSR